MVWTTLAHHIDMELLYEAYRLTRKDGAVGVDGQTAEQYARELDTNLRSLLDRFKSGTYRAPPVRRVHIPKDEYTTRPIGIPTFEDKVLQRAVVMVLEAVYEQQFSNSSYGFRPGRSAHHALDTLWHVTMDMGSCWVVELDIRSFDSMDHGHLRSILDQRIRDGVIRRMVDKWLKAGVLEQGQIHRPQEGTPQGGVVSPLLANIYLHEVLDRWFEEQVRPRMRKRAELIRYADDAVLVFGSETDARRVLEVLPKRFGKYGLTLHPEKTGLVAFRPRGPASPGVTTPGSFDLLGFRHFWARSKKGRWVVKRKTAPKRFTRALRRVAEWCRRHLHDPVAEQHARLSQMLRGHYAYYGITGNSVALERFRFEVLRTWHKWLNRRSQRRSMPWDRYQRLLQRYRLPTARAVHSVYARA